MVVHRVTSSNVIMMTSSHVIGLLHIELHQFSVKRVCYCEVKIPLRVCARRGEERGREGEEEEREGERGENSILHAYMHTHTRTHR